MSTFCVYSICLLFSSYTSITPSFFSLQKRLESKDRTAFNTMSQQNSFTFEECCGNYSVLNPCKQWHQFGGLCGTKVSFGTSGFSLVLNGIYRSTTSTLEWNVSTTFPYVIPTILYENIQIYYWVHCKWLHLFSVAFVFAFSHHAIFLCAWSYSANKGCQQR